MMVSRWRALVLVLMLAFLASGPLQVHAQSASTDIALAWLLARQQDDGSFPGFGPGATADAVFALVAAGVDPNGVLKNNNSPITALGTSAASFAGSSTSAAAKLVLAVVAAGKDPRSFGGQDLVALIQSSYRPATGVYGANPTDHAFALLALLSAGQPISPAAFNAAARIQRADGGWSFDGGAKSTSDTNTTALMVQAYSAAGINNRSFTRAVAYLKSQQNSDGGFTYSKASEFGSDTDANSTALTIQALVAAGVDPSTLKQSGGDPFSALRALQNANGAFRYQAALADDNDLATAQAIPALLSKPLPLVRLAAAPVPATLPNTGGDVAWSWLVLLAGLMLASSFAVRRRV